MNNGSDRMTLTCKAFSVVLAGPPLLEESMPIPNDKRKRHGNHERRMVLTLDDREGILLDLPIQSSVSHIPQR